VIEAGFSGHLRVRNPWPDHPAEVVSGEDGRRLVHSSAKSILEFPVEAGKAYVVELAGHPIGSLPYAAVGGVSATAPKFLGTRSIGLASPSNK